MGVQQEIFDKFRAVQTTNTIPPFENPESRGMDDMNFIDFLFELIQQTKGQKEFKNSVLKGVLGEITNDVEIKNEVFNILKSTFFCDFDILIPEKFSVGSANGISISINEIDPFNLLEIDPNSQVGKHMYEGNDSTKHFNYFMYTALSSTPQNPIKWKTGNRILFEISYKGDNEFVFRFGKTYIGKQFSEWAEDYFNSFILFNLPNFSVMIMDILSGIVSFKTGKSIDSIKLDNRILQAFQKLFGFCKNDPAFNVNEEKSIYTSPQNFVNQSEKSSQILTTQNLDEIFNFTPFEETIIDDQTQLKNEGKIRFSTCGAIEIPMNIDSIFNKLDVLFDNKVKSSDGLSIIDGAYNNDIARVNLDETTNFFDESLKEGAKTFIDNGGDNIIIDLPNMQMELEMNIIKLIPTALTTLLISPKLMTILKTGITLAEDVNIKLTTEEIIKKIGNIVKEIGKKIGKKILQNIFDYVKKILLKILTDISTKYLKQRAIDYAGILAYLVKLIGGLLEKTDTCGGMLTKILKILNLNFFPPQMPLPAPLILVGVALKPGLNQVAVVNELKSKLQSKGIETGAFYSDGTPNYMMYALEETINTLIQHIKMNAQVQTMGMAGPIPSLGYGQIL